MNDIDYMILETKNQLLLNTAKLGAEFPTPMKAFCPLNAVLRKLK
jgi:hypothetical protein